MVVTSLLTAAQVAAILQVSESSIWNWQYGRKAAPADFPPPVKLAGLVRWRDVDVDNFVCGMPPAKTGRIPSVAATEKVARLVCTSPVRGRGRPRKTAVAGDHPF